MQATRMCIGYLSCIVVIVYFMAQSVVNTPCDVKEELCVHHAKWMKQLQSSDPANYLADVNELVSMYQLQRMSMQNTCMRYARTTCTK